MKMIFGDVIKIIRRFFKVVDNHNGYAVGLFLGSIIGHGMQLLTPVFMAQAVQSLTEKRKDEMMFNLLMLGLSYVVYHLAWLLNYWAYSQNSRYVFKDVNDKVMQKIMTYDINFSKRISKGTILNTINSDILNIAALIDKVCEMLVGLLKIGVMIFVFLNTNVWVGIAVLVVQYIYMRFLDYNNIKIVQYLAEQKKYRDNITGVLGQILSGFMEVRTLNVQNKVRKNFNVLMEKWSRKYLSRRRHTNLNECVVPMLPKVVLVLLYMILSMMVLNGKMELAAMLFLTVYFDSMTVELKTLMNYSRDLREYDVSIQRVMRIMNYRNLEKLDFGDLEQDEIDGTVRFRNVSYSYKAKNSGSVRGVSFTARPNQVTAIVGYSGSGKTTLVNLLLRRYRVDKGVITIDAKNIYRYSNGVYARNVAAVNQMPFMFDMSIRRNLGLVESNFAKQVEACKRVGVHDYIASLPNGYNTILTENATNFIEGQKQLLAIARALLTRAEILIFDEVTSVLDAGKMEQLREVLEDLKQDHTVIIVTHNKEMMKMADKVVVMYEGTTVGEGTHVELMKDNQYYINIQRGSYIDGEGEELIAIDDDGVTDKLGV